MKLTAKFIQAITKPGRYYDDAAPGLFLFAQSHTRKGDGETMIRLSFVQRLTVEGKRRDIGLGSPKWGAVTLTEARARAIANYRIARNGGDPREGKATIPSFADAADKVIAAHAETWKDGGKSEKQWRSSLATYVYPAIGRKSVAKVTTADVLALLMPHWSSKRETMRRVKQRISRVMQWSIAEGHRADDPAGPAIGAALPRNGVRKQHQRALPYGAVGGALARVRASGAWWATKAAFEFLTLTATRSGEVRGARWEEFDFDAAEWTVPSERMKARRPHRVPLSPRAVEVLREAAEHSDGSGLTFPSLSGRPMSDMTMSKLCKELNLGMVPHGARTSFRMWAAEQTNIPREVCEEALAHVNPNRVEAAYQRSDLFDRRRDLMSAWARFISTDTDGRWSPFGDMTEK